MYPKTNTESWAQIREFVASYPDDATWSSWKQSVSLVISALERNGLTDLFRIGQSMHHIMLSTLDHHCLAEEPRVTLEFGMEGDLVRVAYSTANLYFCDPVSQAEVSVPEAIPVVLQYLSRLWTETKPSVALPDALKVA
jgi:hypothetical protein